jgi:N-acetylglucosaminyldiphosphoundecaprenol N-acetyl-beta-D-mannosaminyltransferase
VRTALGTIHADRVTFAAALDRIAALVTDGHGGYVLTPNVDHVVLADSDARLRAAYRDASLSLVDGMPLVWLSRALGATLPEKISGSDLVRPLAALAASRGWRLYLLGGMPGIAERAAAILTAEHPGLAIAGTDAPPLGFDTDPAANARVLERVRAARPHLLLVALGCPKQELWMHAARDGYAPAVALGIGASLDFIAGAVRRAPSWMSRAGLEWLYRLAQEPRRMAARYLGRDLEILPIAWRAWRRRHETE